MKTVLAIILAVIIIGIFMILVPVRGNGRSLLRECRFNEASGKTDACFWIWERTLDGPSIYF